MTEEQAESLLFVYLFVSLRFRWITGVRLLIKSLYRVLMM